MVEPNFEPFDIYKKYEKSEIALHKLQLENAKKNSEIIKLKEELQQYKANIANTSTSFPWPEEFKCQWETLIKTMIMDAFENVSLNTILFMRTINIIIKLIYEISKLKIKEKIIELLKCLNIKIKSDDTIKKFFNKYQKILFQNYFNSLFIINDELINKIISQIKNEFLKKYKKIFSEEELNDIMTDLSSNNINSFIKELYYLCLYMNINIPTLTIKTSIDANYRYFNKNEYTNIEGFANDGDICIIIVNPPMVRPNIPFRGIKPVVYMIDNPTKEIINLCKQQNIEKIKKEQSKPFSDSSNNLLFQKINSQNINNQEKINKAKNNYIKKKQSSQIIKGYNSNKTSTNDATSDLEINSLGKNLCNNKMTKKKFFQNLNNNNNNTNKKLNNNNIKMIDIQLSDQQKTLNNNLYLDKSEYKSKSSNKEVENKNNFKRKNNNNRINNQLKTKEYSLTYLTNQKPTNKNGHYYNESNNKEYNIINDRINKDKDISKNKNSKNKINNYINEIEPYVGSNINYINNNSRNYNEVNSYYYQNNSNININPLMNSNYFEANNKNYINENIFEKSRNNNIKLEKKNEFKYNLLNHNNIKFKNDKYRINNKFSNINNKNNKNNKIIITTSDYSKQNISNYNNINNININLNENNLIPDKKYYLNEKSNKSLINNNIYNNNLDYHIIITTPLEITDNSNNKELNTKYTMSVHQITDNSMNNDMANKNNLGRTTIKKISSNNYNLKKIIESNNKLNNTNENSNLSAKNKTNLGIVSRIKNISPYDKKAYSNLKYNLSFKKSNDYNNSDANNNKLLYDNNLYADYSYKTQHKINSNDININKRAYISNINGYNYKKENEGGHNHSNLESNSLNRDFSASSYLSSNSQINPNHTYKRRDYSSNSNNINNHTYNDVIQLKTEISERTKCSYFNNKNDMKQMNNNLIDNIKYSKRNYAYNNSSNRNNIHYTKNNKYTKNIASKKLNFQLNYESNQQQRNNIFFKNH